MRIVACERHGLLTDIVADQLFQQPSPIGLTALDLIELGAVYVNGERSLNPARSLKPGDEVRIHSAPRRYSPPADLSARILAESQDTILVEKPPGLPAGATVDNVRENLLCFLEDIRGQSLFISHHIEIEDEGLMLIAKTHEAARRIESAFRQSKVNANGNGNEKIQRTYVAYVEKPIDLGRIIIHGVQGADGVHLIVVSCLEQRASTQLIAEGRTSWKVVEKPLDVVYRLELEFQVARPKQVREFLASLGAPILGDRACGSPHTLLDAITGKSAMAFRAIHLALRDSIE